MTSVLKKIKRLFFPEISNEVRKQEKLFLGELRKMQKEQKPLDTPWTRSLVLGYIYIADTWI